MFVKQAACLGDEWSDTFKLIRAFKVNADNSYIVNHPPLRPEENVLIIVANGNGYLNFEGFSKNLSVGDIVVFNSNGQYFNYNTIGDVWDFWWFEFSGEIKHFYKNLSLFSNKYLLDLCDKCLDFAICGEQKNASYVLSALLTLITLQDHKNEQLKTFNKAIHIIGNNLGSVTVSKLAHQLRVSERTLHDIFVLNAGCSPKKYILNLKFDTACFLLENTNKSVFEISEYLGFSSQFHFSRFFSSKTNLSPLKWRKKDEFI